LFHAVECLQLEFDLLLAGTEYLWVIAHSSRTAVFNF